MTADDLRARQVEVYRRMGWRIEREDGSEAEAIGPSGARWYILGADADRVEDPAFGRRVDELRDVKVDDGERERRCLVDVVTVPECEPRVKALLGELGLGHAAHVNVYVAA